jgi:hypothetical protein
LFALADQLHLGIRELNEQLVLFHQELLLQTCELKCEEMVSKWDQKSEMTEIHQTEMAEAVIEDLQSQATSALEAIPHQQTLVLSDLLGISLIRILLQMRESQNEEMEGKL